MHCIFILLLLTCNYFVYKLNTSIEWSFDLVFLLIICSALNEFNFDCESFKSIAHCSLLCVIVIVLNSLKLTYDWLMNDV